MNSRWKVITNPVLISFGLGLGIGVLLDRCFKDFPYLQLDPKIGILDIVTLLITITIAFMIPFFVTKILDDKKGIKNLLIDEVKGLIVITAGIQKVISDSHILGEFKPEDRDRINYIFHEAELKISSIQEQIDIADGDSEKIGEKLKDLLFVYKDYLTGGELMLSTFRVVNDRFYMENKTEYSKIETGLKTIIQKLYKL